MPVPYWRLSGFYFAYFALLGATAPYLGLYFHHLGFSGTAIGQLVAIPMLMRVLAPNLWGWLADRTGRRLSIVRLGAACTLLCFSGIYLGQGFAWLALIMAGHAFFWHAVLPQFEAITLAHLRDQPQRYGRIRLWGSIGFIAAVAGLGWAFEYVSLDLYPAYLLLVMAIILLASLAVPGVKVDPGQRPETPAEPFLTTLRQPRVLAFFLAAALMQLSHGPYYTVFTLHLEELGYGRGVIGQLWSLGVVAEVLIFLVMPQLLARLALNTLLVAAFLIAAGRWLLLGALADHLAVLLFAQLLHAATFGCFHAAAIQFVQSHFDRRRQGQAQSLYAALSGAGGALGALYAGYAWQVSGALAAFAGASLAALAGAFLILLSVRSSTKSACAR